MFHSTCLVDDCESRVRHDNPHGYCRKHRGRRVAPPRKICGHTACEAVIFGANKSGYCRDHRFDWQRSEVRFCPVNGCGARLYINNTSGKCAPHSFPGWNQDRRALKLLLHVEDVDRDSVLARHGGKCHICGVLVDPDEWHMDHVIPLVKGGPHCYDNVAPAHPRCNLSKQAHWVGSPSAAVDVAARDAYERFHGRTL